MTCCHVHNDVVPLHVVVLGNFQVGNIADDASQPLFRRLFREVTFVPLQEANALHTLEHLPHVDALVVVGGASGGDGVLADAAAMERIAALLRHTRIPCYALSVHVPPHPDQRRHLLAFDHVWVRSRTDAYYAIQTVGQANATWLPDLNLTWRCLWKKKNKKRPQKSTPSTSPGTTRLRIGLALTPSGLGLGVSHICNLMERILQVYDADLYLFSMQQAIRQGSSTEDGLFWTALTSALSAPFRDRVYVVSSTPSAMIPTMDSLLAFVSELDFLLSARYESVWMAWVVRTPFLALMPSPSPACVTRSMGNLLKDLAMRHRCITVDSDPSMPGRVLDAMSRLHHTKDMTAATAAAAQMPPPRCLLQQVARNIRRVMATQRTVRRTLTPQLLWHAQVRALPPASFDACKKDLVRWLVDPPSWTSKQQQQLAILALTRRIVSPSEAAGMLLCACPPHTDEQHEFRVLQDEDALQRVHASERRRLPLLPSWRLPLLPSQPYDAFCTWDMHPGGLREGIHALPTWVLALYQYDSTVHTRTPDVWMDVHVERTFCTGGLLLSNRAVGLLPYGVPWVGFCRAVFDLDPVLATLHASVAFCESLASCRMLWVASLEYQRRLTCLVAELGYPTLPILCLQYPPTALPRPDQRFTMRRFLFLFGDAMIQPTVIGPEQLRSIHDEETSSLSAYKERLRRHVVHWGEASSPLSDDDSDAYSGLTSLQIITDCIAHRTPMFLPRHPFLETYLGRDYPGFLDAPSAQQQQLSLVRIWRAYLHLCWCVRVPTVAEFVQRVQRTVFPLPPIASNEILHMD
jgi:hypothetical protein